MFSYRKLDWKKLSNKLNQPKYFGVIIAIVGFIIIHVDLRKINSNIDSVDRRIWTVQAKIEALEDRMDLVRHSVDDVGKDIGDLSGSVDDVGKAIILK